MPEDLTITNEETTEEIADNSEVIENDEPVEADNSETEQETEEPAEKLVEAYTAGTGFVINADEFDLDDEPSDTEEDI